MSATTITTLVGTVLAAATAWTLGGREGIGTLAGFLAGATSAGLALALQRRAAVRKPQLVIHAVLGGFLLKAFLLLGLTAAVRFVAPIAQAADWFAFAIAFGAAALAILVPATLDTLRALQPDRAAALAVRGKEQAA